MRGVTWRITPRFVYWICEPPVVLAVPAVTLIIGFARVTSILAVSLSRVTVRGAEIVLASASLLIKESTAFRPSALRNPIAGDNPLAVLKPSPPEPPPIIEFKMVAVLELAVVVMVRPPGNV